jgi:DNA processing protein
MKMADTIPEESQKYWLLLCRKTRVGPVSMCRMIEAFGTPQAAALATARQLQDKAGFGEKQARAIAETATPEDRINKDIEILNRLGARIVTLWDEDYPPLLKEIHPPPSLLFVRGTIPHRDALAVAIVGTRNPSSYGIEITDRISQGLARAGVTVVSGLARGIDTVCHKAALKGGGPTVGVLGCGLDIVYPSENKLLSEEMASKGAVISEFPPATPPLANNFPRRNRIVSGLSRAVVVVEAARNSGALITARHALDQNREVLVVPGSINNRRSWGPHHLLKQGAGLVESAEDILQILSAHVKPATSQRKIRQPSEDQCLSQACQEILQSLETDPIHIDILCESLKIDVARLSGALLELELMGLIRQFPGKMFARIIE